MKVAIAIFLSIGLALSGSRMAWGYLLVVLAVGFFRWWKSEGSLVLPALVFCIFLSTKLFMPEQFSVARSAAESSFISSENTRIILWKHALLQLTDAPLTGTGWGQYMYGIYLNAERLPTTVKDRHAHNIFLQIGAELGLPGLVLVILFGGLLVFKLQWNNLIFGVLMIQGMHSMVEFPMWYAQLLGLAAVMIGLGLCRKS